MNFADPKKRGIRHATLRFALPLLLLAAALGRASPAAAPGGGAAGRLDRDLGEGLAYSRLYGLSAERVAAEELMPGPWVLDVRYAPADARAATALLERLGSRASPRAPVFVLANVETGPELRRALRERLRAPGIIVIGVATPDFQPDLSVRATPDEERRAYDALETGAEVASLLTENPDKERNDEASLSRPGGTEAAEAGPDESAPATAPIDAALQRAMQVHRAWVALRKIR